MWDKKKLEVFVMLNIIAAVFLKMLRVITFMNYRTIAVPALISSLMKTGISYSNSHKFHFGIRNVFLVAGLSFVGTYLGTLTYCHNTLSVSHVISSYVQYLFIAAASTLWCKPKYCFMQYLGLLMTAIGFSVELLHIRMFPGVLVSVSIGALSGLFNAASLLMFESTIKPVLVNLKNFWNYMTAYGFYHIAFSLLHLVEEAVFRKPNYFVIFKSPTVYLLFLLEIMTPYLLSKVSFFLNYVERATLLNVITGLSALITDLYLFSEISIQRFVGFLFVVIGVQLFNFFRSIEEQADVHT